MSNQVSASMRLWQVVLRFRMTDDRAVLVRSLRDFVRDNVDGFAVGCARRMVDAVVSDRWGTFGRVCDLVGDAARRDGGVSA